MLFSIITITYNSERTVEDTIKSVASQKYPDIEHIIIDGGSTDRTLDIVRGHGNSIARVVSERDRGIYDALNKGINISSGKIIGFLHSDDIYANNKVIEKVADKFKTNDTESVYGDLVYVKHGDVDKVVRYWKAGIYTDGSMRKGWMPPHPTFFVTKQVYDKYGLFNPDFRISGDYELMLRFLHKYKITTSYIPEVLVKMRLGGNSNKSIAAILKKTKEDCRAWNTNDLKMDFFTIILKNLSKLPQFVPGKEVAAL